MERLTEYHCGVAVIKDKNRLKDAMQKLASYEDLEEQGLLLRLPVSEGEKVWALTYNVECDCNYDCVEIDNYKCEEGIPCEHQHRDYYVREARFQHQMKEVLGKYIFLTKEEAEKALAEMEKNNENI